VTRYLLGRRAHGERPARLQVVDTPPVFRKGKKKEPEYAMWAGSVHGFHAHQGALREWRADDGAFIVARLFPEECAMRLASLDASIVLARHALEEAEAERQEFLDDVAARAKPVRVAAAKRDRAGVAAKGAG